MRKHFTLALCCFGLFISCSHSQVIKKGDKLFGGGLSISFLNGNNNGAPNNSGNIGLIPSYAWGINDNVVFGIKGQVGYSRSESPSGSSGTRTVNSFSFGPSIFFKKYRELKDRFGVYFNHELGGNYNLAREKFSAIPVRYRSTSWSTAYTFSPGVFYKFSEHFFGEANIGGLSAFYFGGTGTRNLGIGASFLQYFNLGINYRIPRKNS
jgi:hypothetical protein